MNHPTRHYGNPALIMTAVTALLDPVSAAVEGKFTQKGMEAQAEAAESAAYFDALSSKSEATIRSAYAPVWIMGGVLGIAALSLGIMALRKK